MPTVYLNIKIILSYYDQSIMYLTLFNNCLIFLVIPASPINITVVDKTESSVMLRWSVGTMTNFPRELIYKIEYKSQWDSNPENWHVSVKKSMNENKNDMMVTIFFTVCNYK